MHESFCSLKKYTGFLDKCITSQVHAFQLEKTDFLCKTDVDNCTQSLGGSAFGRKHGSTVESQRAEARGRSVPTSDSGVTRREHAQFV